MKNTHPLVVGFVNLKIITKVIDLGEMSLTGVFLKMETMF